MAIFNILNVGQGDSILLKPSNDCSFNRETIFIDLGPGKYDITENIEENEEIHIFFTHHDNDHLDGLRFFIGKMEQVKEITVPFYQNEITLIARAILNLKGIGSSSDCNEFVKSLEEVLNNQIILKEAEKEKNEDELCPKLSFAYEEKTFYDHIKCLNPPMLIDSYDWLNKLDKKILVQLMHELFTNTFAQEMEEYIRTNGDMYSIPQMNKFPEFERFWLYIGEAQNKIDPDKINYTKCNYVLNFIMNNILLLIKFNNKASRNNLRKIYKNYVKCTHNVCMVLKTSFNNTSFLLTGDASKKVFKRLMHENKDISATYLKMPHHGSKHNMNKKILDKINPKVAIISHNNGHFGTAKDTHPNQEILNLLREKDVKILVTNDVIKNGSVTMKKQNYKEDSYVNIM